MNKRLPARRLTLLLFALAIILLVSFGSYSFITTTHKADAAGAFIPHPVVVSPNYFDAGQADTSGFFPCQSAASTVRCYAPEQFQTAYAIKPLLARGLQGQGRTIVIIDAYQSKTIREDLATFSHTFQLPDANLSVIAPDGVPAWNPKDTNMVAWGTEISLDVQWAHAVAPLAKIVLVEAKSNQDADLLSVTKYAVTHNLGDVISQSFGEAERCADPAIMRAEHEVFKEAARKQITLLASSGDDGSAQQTCDGNNYIFSASTPASDPLVTAVGGTQLIANLQTGAYMSESVWNETASGYGAGGGGFSTIYSRPDYQNKVSHMKGRGVPDISANAALNGGVLAAVSYLPEGKQGGPWHVFGGTSASSPEWAGLIALADQMAGHRLGQLNQALYKIGNSNTRNKAFHDIITGNNGFTGKNTNGQTITIDGYRAKTGWDAASGWGSPIAANLLPLLDDNDH
ncbi:MAG TPA: S53 family peptidase [Ktedonobacteraceae bacterium]|nr:S53 family peptidase [Ktedonobacteraceae bacterium]